MYLTDEMRRRIKDKSFDCICQRALQIKKRGNLDEKNEKKNTLRLLLNKLKSKELEACHYSCDV